MSIGDLATILTVAGVSIYVLGLIGLAIPIRRVFTGEISTAWYVVSLVPKTVVAGQGVRIGMLWTGVFAASLLVLTVGLRLLGREWVLFPLFPLLGVIAGAALALPLAQQGWFTTHKQELERLGRQGPSAANRPLFRLRLYLYMFALAAPVCVGGALVLDSLTMLTYPEYFPEVGLYFTLADWLGFHPATGDPSVFRGIVVLLIGSFFLGLPFAISAAPPWRP